MTTLPTPRRTLRRHRLTRTSTFGAALLLALAACGADSPDPDASPSEPSASVTPGPATTTTAAAPASESESSSASATAGGSTSGSPTDDGAYVPASEKGPARNVPKPVMPEAVKEDTPEGAEAAVEYWWDAVYYLQQTNDPEPLKAVSTTECKICSSYIDTIDQIYTSGGWHTGTAPSIDSIITQDLEYASSSTMLMTIEAGRAYSEDGAVVADTEVPRESKQPWRAITRFDDAKSRWLVEEATYEGADE
ncbi:hypothetical protein E4A47_00850 [Micrococcus flavus]|uniref:DUF6318 domain-containing protein n=1 Tax=Micrococcus flavus TaxID=384602 RepID=A0A4Y8X4G9_9MICC|nr:DUF6318 family protein [Micrococcus flavus]MBB4882793.1 hypothetical protein [Micrococcus flavus]TFI04246.1 hypothetical protein E4A47_00850 [Micrococcus flavus]GGK40175.1 hypothetical protein GCM10007073_03680 [Micrococcus flavus]